MDTGLSEVDNAVAEFGGAFDVHVMFPEDSRICGQPHCLARYRVEWDFIPSESPGAREEDREGHHFVRWRLKGSSFTGSLRGVTTLTRAEAEALDAGLFGFFDRHQARDGVHTLEWLPRADDFVVAIMHRLDRKPAVEVIDGFDAGRTRVAPCVPVSG